VMPLQTTGISSDRAFVAIFLAPVVEELVYRGALYNVLRSTFRFGYAAICSAAIFGAMHNHGIESVTAGFAAGLGLAAVREWRGALTACVAAHVLVNAMAWCMGGVR